MMLLYGRESRVIPDDCRPGKDALEVGELIAPVAPGAGHHLGLCRLGLAIVLRLAQHLLCILQEVACPSQSPYDHAVSCREALVSDQKDCLPALYRAALCSAFASGSRMVEKDGQQHDKTNCKWA
jgi:hypothetical protein